VHRDLHRNWIPKEIVKCKGLLYTMFIKDTKLWRNDKTKKIQKF
jgi:hypothetical protein